MRRATPPLATAILLLTTLIQPAQRRAGQGAALQVRAEHGGQMLSPSQRVQRVPLERGVRGRLQGRAALRRASQGAFRVRGRGLLQVTLTLLVLLLAVELGSGAAAAAAVGAGPRAECAASTDPAPAFRFPEDNGAHPVRALAAAAAATAPRCRRR